MSKLKQDFGVRALISVIILVPTILSLVCMAATGSNEALVAVIAMASSVTGYYFGQRGKTQ
jgi:hypothetical protein